MKKKSMTKWGCNETLQLEYGSKRFCLTARSWGEAGRVSAPRPSPQLPSSCRQSQGLWQRFQKNTSSHVTISKYRQGVGDMREPLHPHGLKFRSLSPHPNHLKPETLEWRKKCMKKWGCNGTLQSEYGSKKFRLTAGSLEGLGGSRHRDPLPSSHPNALSPRAYVKNKNKKTSSHVTIPKYRQALGDWRVPLHPHSSKFTSMSPHPDHLNPGSPEWSKRSIQKMNTWIRLSTI
jgi:hypothetical protein